MNKKLGHYEVIELIGSGGMGEVFLAHDQSLGRRVALKLLPEDLQQDETTKKRFLREAKSAAALDHPYICKIYEIGEAEGNSFIAMEYVGGETLQQRLARGPLPLEDAERIAAEIAEALETAHQKGIVHRDLKPSNIMLSTGGHVKVLDFGLAKQVTDTTGADSQFETESQLTGKGLTPGTPAYMSPEQLRGEAVDPRSDIFSLGLVVYEMLAGAHPFVGATSMDTTAGILNKAPTPLSGYRKDIPEPLEHLVEKMLAKTPDDRYQLVHEVRTDLARARGTIAPTRRTPLWKNRRIGLSMGAVALVAVLVALGAWWLASSRDAPVSSTGHPSVAVLPLRNLSQDPMESDYLAEGISQAVITKLTQAGLRVTSWETARRYGHSGEPAESIGQELNVDNVLVGTFQLSGDRILTTLALVEAKSGLQSWADEFEEPFEDLFQVQRRIAMGAATSLKKELTGEEEIALATPESRSVDAYDFYMQGAHILQEGGEEATSIAFEYFTRAVELDANLTEAHVGLGAAHFGRFFYGWGGLNSLDNAEASYEKALELNAESMRARRGLIQVRFSRGLSEGCLIQGQLAARSDRPNGVEALLARADAYAYGGLPDRAQPLYRRVIEMDPLNQAAHWQLFLAFLVTGEFEESIEAGNTYLRRFGDDAMVHTHVAVSHQILASGNRALEHYEKALEFTSTHFLTLYYGGLFFEKVGEHDRAEEVWQRGVKLFEADLELHPDHALLRFVLASLYGLLGEHESALTEEEQALTGNVSGIGLPMLAAVRAKQGEADRAAELLRHALRQGGLPYLWKLFFQAASVPPPQSAAFDQFLQEYEAEEQRLRELY